ncbi:MAG: hypothetical protein P1P87_13065 [Trueperaceae bacterium]|nr:hypothetical protein [Trueperaceae bacterium]
MSGPPIFRDLIGRTLVALAVALAVVALSVTVDLPRTGGDGPHVDPAVHGTP